ncbi:MAG: NADH-quinone oxidoreductase subunit J [Acidimicrobiia bacterium]|nr:NADH-quinone oxidoreductase subunit J [Acidimicrobiia bacterium]
MVVETILFFIFAGVALGGAVTMVWSRNPVHSAMGLMATLFAVAVFYVMNSGHFIAAVQVLVYAGAVMTLFLFVIMLIGVDKSEDRSENLPFQRQAAFAMAGVFALIIIVAGSAAWVTGGSGGPAPNGTVERIADELFGDWVLPFELTAVLLIVAAAGTIALAQYQRRQRVTEEALLPDATTEESSLPDAITEESSA